MQERLYRNLLKAAQSETGTEGSEYLRRAEAMLTASPSLDGTLLEAVKGRLALVEQQIAAERAREDINAKEHATRIAEAKQRYQLLLRLAGSSTEPHDSRLKLCDAAIALAKDFQFDSAGASDVRRAIQAQSRDQAPIAIPEGTTAHVRTIHRDAFPPVLTVDLHVADRKGTFLPALSSKDFSGFLVNGSRVPCDAAIVKTPSVPLRLLVALDRSESTKGQALAQAKEGLSALIRSLPINTYVKIVTFQSRVELACDWTSDASRAISVLGPLDARGQTALLAALDYALRDLGVQTGSRLLVVFTDGRNTVPSQVTMSDLRKICVENDISLHAIGLGTRELDREFLRSLTQATAGTLTEVANAVDLAPKFVSIADQLRAPLYRVAIRTASSSPLSLTVGGGPHSLSIKLPTTVLRAGE